LWRKQFPNKGFFEGIIKIHEDQSGQLWVAGQDNFSFSINDKWETHQFNPAVYTGEISSLKNGLVIVGISESGLALFNPDDNSYSVTFPFGDEMVRYYDHDKNGNCFIILQNLNGISRLIRYDGENIEALAEDLKIDGLSPGACEVTGIVQTQNDDIWITTFTDFILFKKGIRTSFDLKKEFGWGLSTSILELDNGNIWISGSKGILQYADGNWSIVQSPEFETARMMTISSDGCIWVASGTGVHRFINGNWISNSIEEGLPNAMISDIIEDKQGSIRVCTYNGVYCYYPETDIDTPETTIPLDMNSHEAVPSGEIQFVFQGHDKWANTPDHLLQYSYRFDENSWTPFDNQTIAMGVGLSAGHHIFEVRAIDRNGLIDPTPASWSFTVLLPWYKETPVLIFLVFAIVLIILSLGLAISRHFRIEKLVKVRTAELVKTKEIAEESERSLQNANRILKIGKWDLNHQTKTILWSEETFRIFEIDIAGNSISYEDFLETIHPDDRNLFKDSFAASINSKITCNIDYRLLLKSGEIKNVHQKCETTYDNLGIPIISTGTIQDITERKQAEHDLIRSQEKLNLALKGGEIGVWEWDIETGQVIWDAKTERMFGLEEGEFQQTYKAFMELLHPDDIDSVKNAIKKTITNLTPFESVFRVVSQNKENKYIRSKGLITKDADGNSSKMIGIVFDISNIKNAELEIKSLNENLEQRIIERTAQLEASNKELEAFSYSVSHDLRAPLRGINGFTQILMDDYADSMDKEFKRVCSIISDNSLKMGHLIDDLLTFSRLGRFKLEKSAIDMEEMVSSIYHEITNEESRNKIIIEIGKLCTANGNSAMLRLVWTNLLSNAIKFSSKSDRPMISVSCKNENKRCIYSISDNGAGFNMKYAEKLFGVFQRLHRDDEFKGTGVGLANVQRIILRHGGEVWAESEVDNGAKFYFSIPDNGLHKI